MIVFLSFCQAGLSIKTVGPHLQQLQGLLKDAILRVCEDKAPFLKKLKIEGTVCVTTDLDGVIVTQIAETLIQSERRDSAIADTYKQIVSPRHQVAGLSSVSHESKMSPKSYPVKIFNRDSPRKKIKIEPRLVETVPDEEDCVVIMPQEPHEWTERTYSWHQPVTRIDVENMSENRNELVDNTTRLDYHPKRVQYSPSNSGGGYGCQSASDSNVVSSTDGSTTSRDGTTLTIDHDRAVQNDRLAADQGLEFVRLRQIPIDVIPVDCIDLSQDANNGK